MPIDAPKPSASASSDASCAPVEEIWKDDSSSVFTDALDHSGEDTLRNRVPYDLYPEFVGHDQRLGELLDILARTRRTSELAFVLLLGEPGMGKSRTIKELGRSIKQRHPDTRMLVGRGDGSGVAYAAFARLLARRFGIGPGLPAEASQQRILECVSHVLPSGRVTEVAHLLAHLMRIPLPDSPVVGALAASPQQLETRMFIAVRRFLAADSASGPIVLVIEDLEGCSPESINLVQYLAAGLRSSPVMILATARTTLFERYPSFGEGDVPLHRIELMPLSDEASATLLRGLCRPLQAIPKELEEHARALGGSPRALLELMRFLLESNIIVRTESNAWTVDQDRLATIKLPDSYPELVGQRLDVMDPGERALLSMAAVVGEVFWLDAVVALVRARQAADAEPDGPPLREIAAHGDKSRIAVTKSLAQLTEREWITPTEESSAPGEHEYRFAYPHLRTMILERIPADERRGYHRTAAQWLALRPEGERPLAQEDIARHLEQAGLMAEAAARYRSAADHARKSYFNQRAIRLYTRALACIGASDVVTRMHLWHDLGSVYEFKGDFEAALGAFERMLRLAWVTAARGKAAVAFNKMGRVWRRKGDLKLSLEYLERGTELFELIGDERGIAGSLDDIGRVLYLLGRYDEAHEKVTAGLERRREGDPRALAMSLSNLGNIQRARGLLSEARACHQEALDLRRQSGDRSGVIASLNDLAVLDYEHGDLAQARAGWMQALDEAEDIGALPLCALAQCNLGELALAEHHHDEARRHLEDALAIADDIEDRRLKLEIMRNMALLENTLGHTARARELAERSHELATASGLRDSEARALLCLALVTSASLVDTSAEPPEDPMSRARLYYEQGVSLLRELGNDSELAHGLEQYGRYKVEIGDAQGGVTLLREALGLYRRLDMKRRQEVERFLASLA